MVMIKMQLSRLRILTAAKPLPKITSFFFCEQSDGTSATATWLRSEIAKIAPVSGREAAGKRTVSGLLLNAPTN